MILTVNDETLSGDILYQLKIAVQSERIKVKDLIAARVEAEIKFYNEKLPEYFKGLIQPTDAEKTLNGYKLKKGNKKIDVDKQTFVAFDAFQKNSFLLLVDDNQAEDLEEEILVNKETIISFVKLTPLVGG